MRNQPSQEDCNGRSVSHVTFSFIQVQNVGQIVIGKSEIHPGTQDCHLLRSMGRDLILGKVGIHCRWLGPGDEEYDAEAYEWNRAKENDDPFGALTRKDCDAKTISGY